MNTYTKMGLLTVIIVGTLTWLALGGVSETSTYYKEVSEIQKMGAEAQAKRLRVGGDVVPGSIKRDGAKVLFTLSQGANTINVVYTGTDPIPDTFRDQAMAVVDGKVGPDGVFYAKAIQAKCASKYQAKPGEIRKYGEKPAESTKPVQTSAAY